MILSLLAATTLAASPTLTVRRDCDAAGGLPSAKAPLTVGYASADGKLNGELKLGTLTSTTAKTSFSILLSGRAADTRTLVFMAFAEDGSALGKALVDVDVATGEVLALDGAGLAVSRFRGEEVRAGGDEAYAMDVTLDDEVARYAVMVTLADVTGDGAVVYGDPFEQALALGALNDPGGLIGRWTFDDARGIDSSRQTWEGTTAVDAAYDGAALAFSARADLCMPEGVEAPADGTLEWTETLRLQGSAKSPKWKSVSLSLREGETETWVWPFSARIQDAEAPSVTVWLGNLDGALAPRTSEIVVTVPARERLSASTTLPTAGAGTETVTVSVHPFGVPSRPLTTFVVTRGADGLTYTTASYLEINDEKDVIAVYDYTKDTWSYAEGGPGRAGRGASATLEGEVYRFSSVVLSGPEQADWDGSIAVAVSGDAVWEDLEVTASLSSGAGVVTKSFPLTTLESVFEGSFVFDADPTGGTYRWDCEGCGDDFEPFEVQAGLGTGTRTSSSQANNKAELL